MARVSATGKIQGRAGIGKIVPPQKAREIPLGAGVETRRVSATGICVRAQPTSEARQAVGPMMAFMKAALEDAQKRGVTDPAALRRIVLDARAKHLRRS